MNAQNILNEGSPWLADPDFRYQGIIVRGEYGQLINLENDLVQILLGARRIGKTSIMRQLINGLLDDGRQVFSFSADNPLLDSEGFYQILDEISRSSKQKKYIFIDEIQSMPGWQKHIKYFYDNSSVKFVISGSSSLIIDKESAKLTGRHQLVRIWPLDFSEAKRFDPKITLEKYLRDGSYPEVVLGKIEPIGVVDIVESTLLRDLLSLYQIRNPIVLSDLIKLLAAKVGTPVSKATLAKDLGIDDQTVAKLLNYLVGMRILIELPIYAKSQKIQLRNPSKYYFIDSGIVNKYSLQPKLGLLAENVVAIALEKIRGSKRENWGYMIEQNQEIDFRIGNELFEVKYREDWLDQVEKYEIGRLGAREKLRMILPSETTFEHPGIEFISLGRFLLER